ncbi:MAG: hypothetical protein HQ570_03025 [Candidatus Omnitrophica bacterium]|nr:hypothetical protein [Candidatus Omnitrophota bacterium]
MSTISSIYLYGSSGEPEYKVEEITTYLKNIYPKAKTEERGDFFPSLLKRPDSLDVDELAKRITCSRVHNVSEKLKKFSPLPLEIEYEKKRLSGEKQLKGIIYDGFNLQAICRELLGLKEFNSSSCHIIFTNQLLASFDNNDRRYHLRAGIYGQPNIISVSGLVEALAKPREYYLKMQIGQDALSLSQEFKGDIIEYEDTRITELLKGYCLQAIFYHLSGDPFCSDKNCRLYNAHWQKDAILAQIEAEYEFCPKHTEIISQWKNR